MTLWLGLGLLRCFLPGSLRGLLKVGGSGITYSECQLFFTYPRVSPFPPYWLLFKFNGVLQALLNHPRPSILASLASSSPVLLPATHISPLRFPSHISFPEPPIRACNSPFRCRYGCVSSRDDPLFREVASSSSFNVFWVFRRLYARNSNRTRPRKATGIATSVATLTVLSSDPEDYVETGCVGVLFGLSVPVGLDRVEF